jgi:hypothetical protein
VVSAFGFCYLAVDDLPINGKRRRTLAKGTLVKWNAKAGMVNFSNSYGVGQNVWRVAPGIVKLDRSVCRDIRGTGQAVIIASERKLCPFVQPVCRALSYKLTTFQEGCPTGGGGY